VGSWTPAASEAEALRLVTEPGFDPERTAIVEVPVDVNPTAEGATGSATYRADSTQSARVHVEARAPSLVLVRNAHEDAWRAEVDGRPAPVLRADYFLQAVPVPPGEHTVVLRYEDRTIAYGLWGSGLSIALLGAVALALRPHRAPSHAPPVHRGEP
jgi:hypothetical protein